MIFSATLCDFSCEDFSFSHFCMLLRMGVILVFLILKYKQDITQNFDLRQEINFILKLEGTVVSTCSAVTRKSIINSKKGTHVSYC